MIKQLFNIHYSPQTLRFYFFLISSLINTGCVYGTSSMTDNSLKRCANKPNCVSTLDQRPAHAISPFILTDPKITMTQILTQVSQMPRAKIVDEKSDYARIEFTSPIMGFVDDLELRIQDQHLIVRSESRIGYYDFNANRKRTTALRQLLQAAGLIT